ncbi:MAG: murein biosynthesis integral membrane protein MurJ [Gammaproteobacteria bacterium]
MSHLDQPDPSADQLSRQALAVSAGTATSRITGLLRDIMVFTFLGISPAMDALVLALRLPAVFYRFVIEGGFIRLLIPRLIKAGDPAHYIAQTFWGSLVAISGVTLCVWLLLPWIAPLLAPGFDDSQRALAVQLLEVILFYLPLATMIGYCAAILNSRSHYLAPAYMQVIVNLSIAGAVLVLVGWVRPPHLVVVGAMVAGAVLQLLLLLGVLKRLNALPAIGLSLKNPALLSLLRGIVLVVCITMPQQVGIWISFGIGSSIEPGSPSRLYLAERLIHLPMAVIGMAIATVVLPVLTRQNASQIFAKTLDWSIQAATLLSIPATVGLWLISDQLLHVLFAWREIHEEDLAQILIIIYSMLIAIPFSMVVQILYTSYYSRQQYSVIFFCALGGMLTLSVATWTLAIHAGLGAMGVGLGSSLGTVALALCLMAVSIYRSQWRPDVGHWLRMLFLVAIATGAMALVVIQIRSFLASWLPLTLLILTEIVVAVSVYFALLKSMGITLTGSKRKKL